MLRLNAFFVYPVLLVLTLYFGGCLGAEKPSCYSEPSSCNLVVVDAKTGCVICCEGEGIHERACACSTFKIALSLMGFDSGILVDEENPKWRSDIQEFPLEFWKGVHCPQTWLKYSVVWYSQKLTPLLGIECIENYLDHFEYGNKDMSGNPGEGNGLLKAWLSSSLKISPFEQTIFLQRLVNEELSLSKHAMQTTKKMLFQEELENGWRLYAKTGSGYDCECKSNHSQLIWYVGWLEKDDHAYVFALNIRKSDHCLSKSERKNLLLEALEFE